MSKENIDNLKLLLSRIEDAYDSGYLPAQYVDEFYLSVEKASEKLFIYFFKHTFGLGYKEAKEGIKRCSEIISDKVEE